MGNASLMFQHLQNIFTVIILFDSQNGPWWRQSGYYCFIVEKPWFIEALSLARSRWPNMTVIIALASMPLDFKSSTFSLALSFSRLEESYIISPSLFLCHHNWIQGNSLTFTDKKHIPFWMRVRRTKQRVRSSPTPRTLCFMLSFCSSPPLLALYAAVGILSSSCLHLPFWEKP